MFALLSKTLSYLLSPLVWIVLLFLLSYWVKDEFKKLRLKGMAFLLLLVFSSPYLSNMVFQKWEGQPQAIAEVKQYDYGVLLTGVVQLKIKPRDRVYFNKGADRVLHTLRLFRAGKIRKIVITGGTGSLRDDLPSEALLLRNVFLDCGIPDTCILTETKSFNTRENALFTKALLDSIGYKGKVLLITSAFHMPRSKACFDKVGVDSDTFTCDYYSTNDEKFEVGILFPSERALVMWHVLFHEWFGLLTYKMMGYI